MNYEANTVSENHPLGLVNLASPTMCESDEFDNNESLPSAKA